MLTGSEIRRDKICRKYQSIRIRKRHVSELEIGNIKSKLTGIEFITKDAVLEPIVMYPTLKYLKI